MLKAVRAWACRLSVNTKNNKGFTIVELMIALSVLSTILVAASLVMIQVGHLYVKGVNAADLQTVNRSVVADVTSALQFSGNKPQPCMPTDSSTCPDAAGFNAYCVGTTRYTYILNREQGTDQYPPNSAPPLTTPHVLWRDVMPDGSSCQPLDNPPGTTGGYDMLPDHMRLTDFSINETAPNSGVYNVKVSMAYGDSDLLTADQHSCNGKQGQQFCSTSTITSTVSRRVQ